MKPLTPEHALAMHFGRLLIRDSGELPDGFEDRLLALAAFDENGEMVPDPREELQR